MIKFGIVGTGWRSLFYLRIAQACPEQFEVAGLVTRDQAKAALETAPFGTPLFSSIGDMARAADPLFVVTSVPWDANPGVIKEIVELGLPVLSETPPARTVAEMEALYQLIQQGAKIEVAEQYWAQPHHAARIAFAHSGKLGTVSQVQLSAAHGYHGISLIRRFLGIGYENATISAHSFSTPIVKSPDRTGPPVEESIATSTQTIATLDFGDRFGVFDFTGDQYFSYIRGQRLLVRGERGEIIDHRGVYLQDQQTPIQVQFTRQVAGPNGNLEGHYLKGIQAGESWVYHNPLAPATLSDEEVAIGTCLLRMAEHAQGGPSFYSLAEACQDRYLDIMMAQSLERGESVQTETQNWAT